MSKPISREDSVNKRPLRLYKRNWIDVNEEVAVTSLSGETFWLNETAAFIWKLCDGKHSIKDIVDSLIEGYDVDRSTAIDDVFEIIWSLEERKLIGLQ